MTYFNKINKTNLDTDYDFRRCHDADPDDPHLS